MAEIDVKIKGDDTDFKKKLAESATATEEFSKIVKEKMAEIKESAADVLKESGFGGIAKGITGGQVAMVAFGAAVVEGFKHSIEAATEFEKNVKSLSFALPVATAGMADELAHWVESVSGAMGSVEENMAAFQKLIQAGMNAEEAKRTLVDIQNAAMKTHSSIEALTDAFAEMKVEGEIRPRFFRENLGIAAFVKNLLGPAPPPVPGAPPPSPEAEDQSFMDRVKARGGAAWMLNTVLPMIAPGGLTAGIRSEAGGTAAGKWADVKVQFDELYEEVGTELLPSVKAFAEELKKDLPGITEGLKGFAAGLENVLETIGRFAKPAGDILGGIFHPPTIEEIRAQRERPATVPDWFTNSVKSAWDGMIEGFSEATRAHQQNATDMQRALRPY